MAISGVACPQGGRPAAVFYPFGRPIPHTTALGHNILFFFYLIRLVDESDNLWSLKFLKSTCDMDTKILSEYPKLKDADCPPFSLGTVVMQMARVPGCNFLTQYNLITVQVIAIIRQTR
jgi:hypothetical protein